jgi:hypothetical protein
MRRVRYAVSAALALALGLGLAAPATADAAQNGIVPIQGLVLLKPTPVGRYYAAAKGGYTSASEMAVTLAKQPNEYAATDLAVVVRRMDGTFVSGTKFLKASPQITLTLPSNPSVCAVDWRGDKLCDGSSKVCGGSITQKNHFQIEIFLLSDVPNPSGAPPALGSTFARKEDLKLRLTKGVGLRGFNPATKEYPLSKNANYLPAPDGVNDASTCRPGPEPWPEPEPSYNSNAL